MRSKVLLSLLTLLAGLAPAAFALPTFYVTLPGSTDPNGNGAIDCGEDFELQVVVFDDAPVISPISPVGGTITIPTTTFQTAWRYVPGTIDLDPITTENCSMVSILAGNAPADDRAIFTYSCIPSPGPGPSGHTYVLAARIRGTYVGTTGPFFVTAQDELDSGELLTSDLTGSDVQGCPRADLSLAKTDGGNTVLPGQTIAYALNYANAGDAADAVTLRETVPVNVVANLDVSSPGWSCSPSTASGSTCTLSLGNLPAGAAGSRTFAVDVLPTAVTPLISNTAVVTTTTPESSTSNNTASDTTPVAPGSPDLEIRKSVAGTGASPGSLVVFTIDVRNLGDGPTQLTRVRDTLPAGSIFESTQSSTGWTCASTICDFDLGTVIAGASRSLIFAVRLPSPVPFALTRLDNTACVTTSTTEPEANNCASASTPVQASPDIALVKSLASGQGVPGTTLVFALTAVNNGNRDSAPVTLTETVPLHTTAVASPDWSCSPGLGAGSTCTALLPSLPGAGGSGERSFAVVVDSPLPQGADLIHNSACVTSQGADQDCDEIDVPTDARPMVMVAKSLSSGNPIPGSVLVYTITVQNTGNRASLPISLTETIPPNTAFEPAASSSGWQCPTNTPPATCTLDLGPVDGGGATATRLFALRLDNPLPANAGDIRNVACAEEPTPPAHCDEVTVTPQASPILAIEKLLAQGSPAPGQLVTYALRISNSGNQHAQNVVVTDQLPPHTAFEPTASSSWSCDTSACSLTLPNLAAGTTTTLTLALRIAPVLPASAQTLFNQACATDGPMRTVCDSVESPLGGAPVLSLTKAYDGPSLSPGVSLPFTLTISNGGDRDAVGAVLRETIPPGATFEPDGSDTRWTCQSPAAGSVCDLSLDLAAGATASVHFVLRALSPLPAGIRQIANSACILSPAGDVSACNETTTPLPTFVELSLEDSLTDDRNGNGTLEDGEMLHYTLTVVNPAQQVARNFVVSTRIDPHLALVVGSVSSSGGSIVTGNALGDLAPSISIAQLDPGASLTIEFDVLAVDVLAAQLDEVLSQAEATGSEIETEPSDDPSTPEDDDPTRTPVGDPGARSAIHEIPTLNGWGIGLLSLALAAAAFLLIRRRA